MHGEKVVASFKLKYCAETKSGGGGTQLEEHLAHKGKNVKRCSSVPSNIKTYLASVTRADARYDKGGGGGFSVYLQREGFLARSKQVLIIDLKGYGITFIN